MVGQTDPTSVGDRNQEWRTSYTRVRKDLLISVDATNRRRLAALGAESLPVAERWLDLGCGDGNLVTSLRRMGVRSVVAVEVQPELLAECRPWAMRVVGAAESLPVSRAAVGVAVAMDVMHHLSSDQITCALRELRRVVRPGGWFLVCEPAPTVVRRMLGAALMSPLSSLSAFGRDKRRMVDLEAATLVPWLASEPGFVRRVDREGFALEHEVRRPLNTLRRFRRR